MAAILGAVVAAITIAIADHNDLSYRITGDVPPELCAVRGNESKEEQVTIRIWDRQGRASSGGSGVIVGHNNRKGLVLACAHTHRGGGRNIEVRGHGYRSQAKLVAIDYRKDLAFLEVDAAPGMPVAKIHIREMQRGDSVTLTGFGGGRRGLLARYGNAHDNRSVGARTDYGDSGGPAFVDGKIVGVVVANSAPGTPWGETYVVPLRDVYALANTIADSRQGSTVYQRIGAELCGLFPMVGRALFANRAKRMGKGPWGPRGRFGGGCGPNGCPPGSGGVQGGTGPNEGQPWYAEGYGPGDKLPIDEGNRVAPSPPEIQPEVLPVPDTGNGHTLEVDLSGFVTQDAFDGLSTEVDGLTLQVSKLDANVSTLKDSVATKPDIEIVIGKVTQLQQAVGTEIGKIDTRLTALEQPPVPSSVSHWVLVTDPRAASWPMFEQQVNTALSAGVRVLTVDSELIPGRVGGPQLVPYVDGRPGSVVTGERRIVEELRRLAVSANSS